MKPNIAGKPISGNLGPKPQPKPKPAYLLGKQEGPGYLGNRHHGNKPSAAVWSPNGWLSVIHPMVTLFTLFLSVL